MRRSVVLSAAITACIAVMLALGCDPPASTTKSGGLDTDGDGISDKDELIIYGTSPLLADTDGDGMSDYEEIFQHSFDPKSMPLRFNPRVADTPALVVKIVSAPLLTIRMTDTTGETWTYETTTEFEQLDSFTTSATDEVSFSDTVGGSDTVSREVSFEFQDEPLAMRDAGTTDAGNLEGANAEQPNSVVFQRQPLIFDNGGPDVVVLTSSVSSTVDWSSTDTLTLSFTASQTRAFRQAITFAQGYAVNHEVTAESADLKIVIEMFNRGNIPYRVTNLLLAATVVGDRGMELPVGNLDLNTTFNAWIPWSLAPGGHQGPLVYVRENLTLDQAMMLGDMSGLRVGVGVYELSDAAGRPYVFDVPALTTRTATFDIDYGGRRPRERYLVATNLDPARPGVTLQRAFDEILRIPFEADEERGLLSVRNVVASEPGTWVVEVRHNEAGEVTTTTLTPPYDFRGLLIRAGDVVHFGWSGR